MNSISLAISPCPNDTYIFGAWIQKLIPTNTLALSKVVYLDIQELNTFASQGTFDVIKVSAAHALTLLDEYNILSCGGALGIGCGPLLIGLNEQLPIESTIVGLPGQNTTAHFLFNYAIKTKLIKKYLLFSEIENELLTKKIDAGVIIHENRFTYKNKGLKLILDLGEYWTTHTGLPIPLGLILVKKSIAPLVQSKIASIIKESLKFAHENQSALSAFIQSHAQEMDIEICNMHIDLYVNKYSHDLGNDGKSAVISLFEELSGKKLHKDDIFINI